MCNRPAIQRSVIVVSARSRRASFTFPLSPFARSDNSFSLQPGAAKPSFTNRNSHCLKSQQPLSSQVHIAGVVAAITDVRTGHCEAKHLPNNALELTGTVPRGGQGIWRFSLT